jgi:hypothetical protein
MIGQDPAGNGVTPGQRCIDRDVVEPAPGNEQNLAEQVTCVLRRSTSAQVALEGLVHLGGESLETGAPRRF